MASRYVFVVLMAAAVGLASQAKTPESHIFRSDACPPPIPILPCTCHTNTVLHMTMDCSAVKTNDDLIRVFNTIFPFKIFQDLIIKHSPDDPTDKLTEIPSDTFHDLTFVNVIIQGTQIKTIEENVFSYSYDTLKQLDLQNNKINDFPFETLGYYTRLDTVLLDGNQIPTLEKFPSSSLATLSIGYNPGLSFTFDVLEYIPNLQNLNMEGIGLKVIPQHMFINLTQIFYINFNNNDLTKLEEYTLDPPNPTMGGLILSNNRIYSMLSNALTGFQTEAVIDFSNNEVVEMTQNIWQPLFDQVLDGSIYMTGNPLRCGCDMDWMFLNTTTVISAEIYPPILTEYTSCYDGTKVVYLDVCVFEKHCGSNSCITN